MSAPAGTCVGTDLVGVERTGSWVRRYRPELGYVFTEYERRRADAHPHPERLYAVCFGAKEAVGKALACGLAGMEWTDVEADVTPRGLALRLRGSAAARAAERGVARWCASWSRAGDLVLVCAVGSTP